MTRFFRSIGVCLLALFVVGGLGAGLATAQSTESDRPQDGTALLQSVQARYQALDGLSASFTQTVSSDFSSRATRLSGRLWATGTRYRIETAQQTLVTDGETTWIYSPADSQVVVNTAAQDPSALTPETFFTDYAERYTVDSLRTETEDGTTYRVLTLSPKTPDAAAYRRVVLWVRPSDTLVTRLSVTDRNGSTIRIALRDLTPTAPDPARFQFTPPSGVEVVDLRG